MRFSILVPWIVLWASSMMLFHGIAHLRAGEIGEGTAALVSGLVVGVITIVQEIRDGE